LPYISYYWLEGLGEEGFLRVSGFYEFPVAIARYQVIGGGTYGLGPGWYADSDTRMLYEILKEGFTNMQLFSRPPLQAPGDFLVDYRPGAVTRNEGAGGEKIETLFAIAPIFKELFEVAAATRERINRAYNVNLFAMLEQAPLDKAGRTAYELALRNQEKMRQLGPVIERLNAEFLNVVVKRVYAILARGGVFDDGEGEGAPLSVEYVSPLAQAEKMSGTENIEMLLAITGQVAQVYPEIVHLPQWAELVRTYADKLGTDARLLRSREEFDGILRAARESEAAAGGEYARAAANMQRMAENAAHQPLKALLEMMGGTRL
jgi:hypothetical protein